MREDGGVDLVRGLGTGRIAIGATMLAAPALAGRPWIGDEAEGPGGRALMRGFGARDLAIGAGLLAASRSGSSLRPWLLAGLAADAADALATWVARERLPGTAAGVLAVATTATVLNAWLAARAR